jgi:hypothetical protein
LNQKSHLSSTDDEIIIEDVSFRLPVTTQDEDIWSYIRSMLTAEEEHFLNFLIEKVLVKKYTDSYSVKLRREHYSLTEYKIMRLALQARIKQILKDRE